MTNTVQAATGAGPSTRAKFCFWARQRFACWRAKFAGRLTSDKPPTTISHCCGPWRMGQRWWIREQEEEGQQSGTLYSPSRGWHQARGGA